MLKNGARPAEPGEFTKRAFLNGRIDLVFQYGFILREGTNEQIARYIRLGRQNESRALSPQMVQLMREYMDRYESELNDRLTYAGIRGKVTRGRMDEVYLYKVEDGKECLIATSKVSRDGWYGFTFQPERKGFYTVGGKESLDRIRLYMQPGFTIDGGGPYVP